MIKSKLGKKRLKPRNYKFGTTFTIVNFVLFVGMTTAIVFFIVWLAKKKKTPVEPPIPYNKDTMIQNYLKKIYPNSKQISKMSEYDAKEYYKSLAF